MVSQSPQYPIPAGCSTIPESLLDLRPDSEIDQTILNPPPVVTSEKNIWFFWHTGFENMHPYTQRTIRAYQRRFSKVGWTIRVINRLPGSNLNVDKYLDVHDPKWFPKAFVDGTVGGTYAVQHTSDLVRWPLLLKYGGVYADVGLIQIGDLNRLWEETVGNPDSRFEVMSYNMGPAEERGLANYFLMSRKDSPFFDKCHRLFMALWSADGGKTSTEGMHASPLLRGLKLMGSDGGHAFEEDGKLITDKEVSEMLTDYIAQGQVITLVEGLVDEEEDWNGPQWVADHLYGLRYEDQSQLINEMTAWKGQRAFDLMSLQLPKDGEVETEDQKEAREIVEACLSNSFGFKLAHGLIFRVLGHTLGTLWRKHEGSDNVPGTYAHWLRHGTMYWTQEALPPSLDYKVIAPFKVGPLLREEQ